MDGLIELYMRDLVARERRIEEAQRLCQDMQVQIDSLNDTLLSRPVDNPCPQVDALSPCDLAALPEEPAGASALIVDVRAPPPPRWNFQPKPCPRNTIPPGAQSAKRIMNVLNEWILSPSGHEDLVRRNRSLLKLWKLCAVELGWESWATLPQDWKQRFFCWGNRHISDINHTGRLCFSALTGGWEDFLSNTCCVTAAWGLNAFSAPSTLKLLPPTPLSGMSAMSHKMFFRTDDISQPNFEAMSKLLASDCFFVFLHNRLSSEGWNGWLQKCEDIERGFCFASANRLNVRTYCSNGSAKEQWSWVAGVLEFWLIRGGNQPMYAGLDPSLFDESVASFMKHVKKWDPDATSTPLSEFAQSCTSDGASKASRWKQLREFWGKWDVECGTRKRCFSASPIDCQGIVESCRRMAVCLRSCPDTRLKRVARLAKLPPDLDLNNPDVIIYCMLGPWCPYVGQCGGRQPRAPILCYAEHASKAKSLIRHFVGTRHRILCANAGFGNTSSLARILAAKGPVSAIMFPVERAPSNNIDSRERFYDSLFAPTTNHIRPRGSLNDALWLNIFNHKMAPTTYQAPAIQVNTVLQQRGSQSDLNKLIRLTMECKHYVKPKVYEALFRLLQATLKAKCHFSMSRRVVLRTPTLCDSTQTALRQTIQSHFSRAPMPLFLQDLCKSIVSTTKCAPK